MQRNIVVLLGLLLACALFFAACGGNAAKPDIANWPPEGVTVKDIGSGKTVFALEIKLQDGSVEYFNVHTDASAVGTALLALEGFEKADNGIINTVNGHTLDWETDQAYWMFNVNGIAAMVGAEDTPIEAGYLYAFVYAN